MNCPLASKGALATPGRQVVGGAGAELAFDPATDVFAIAPTVFGLHEIFFANTVTSGLPASGVNVTRLTHFTGEDGRAALSTITAENFDVLQVPEPSSLMLFGAALAGMALRRRQHRGARRDGFVEALRPNT